MRVTVIFDGGCGMCTRTVRTLARLDKRKALTFRPCQSLPEQGWSGISRTECERSVWAVADDGTIEEGSVAAMLMLTAMVNNRWPYRIGKLPGVSHLMQVVYRAVARNRRRFPGETPWCQQHPDDCVPHQEWTDRDLF